MGRPCRSIVTAIAVALAIVINAPFEHLGHTRLDVFQAGHAVAQGLSFLATFSGQPSSPQPWRPADWDVQVHSRQEGTWKTLEPMDAMHASNCGAPPATHRISAYADAVFLCRDHLMTAIHSVSVGYAAIYLTPNRMVDFSQGEAVVRFDMSTFRSSSRDWVDLWISPYAQNLTKPIHDGIPDLNGPPRNAVHILLDCGAGCPDSYFRGFVYRNFQPTELQTGGFGYEEFLVPDAARRDTFELRISRTRIRFGMPQYNRWWLDASIADLGWSTGVVQLGHHSYTPDKDCQHPSFNGCPNTWHWDNVSISPARPFTIIRANQRFADATSGTVTFPQPAPANAMLRYAAAGTALQVSFDNGATWQSARLQDQSPNAHGAGQDDIHKSYWQPIPVGTASVRFRGQPAGSSPWIFQDISIWSDATSSPPPTPTPLPVVCSPRPPVTSSVVKASPGVLRATLTATGANNTIRQLDFDPKDAIVRVAGLPDQIGPFSTTPQAVSTTFQVLPRTAGAATVKLIVTDGCGAWTTFVGGGPSAF